VGQQRTAGVGQADRADAALHQPGSGLLFERGDLLADRRLGVGQRLGRGGERAPDRDLPQHPETAWIEHK
jgi:hypothetical protein